MDYIKYCKIVEAKRSGKLADKELQDLEQVADKDAAWSEELNNKEK